MSNENRNFADKNKHARINSLLIHTVIYLYYVIMGLTKDKNKKWTMNFSSEDFTPVTDETIIVAEDPDGHKVGINLWMYANYFFNNIQEKEVSGGLLYIDGIRIDKFKEYFIKENKIRTINEFLEDSTCYGLQQEMQELHNTHINWVALYGLCMYIREIIDRRLALLLKPTIKETLEEIGDRSNLKSITFNFKKGEPHNSDFFLLKENIVKTLEKCKDDTVEFHKIVRKVDVYTKEYGQIEFVRYISRFFHECFSKVRRRKNSYLTATEQRIICYLLKFFEFSSEVVQESRFRQLFNSKYEPLDHFMPLGIPGIMEAKTKVYMEFLPYSIWKKGKINPLKSPEMHKQNFQRNINMNMGNMPDISELLKVIDGMFG